MAENNYDLSLIIACYNEAAILRDHFRQVLDIMEETRWSFEIIFVDDKSIDDTRQIIETIIEKHPHVPVRRIYHTRNHGRGRTVSDGMRVARGRIVGYFDIDLEVHIQYVVAMMVAIKKGADIAMAERIYKLQISRFHRHLLSAGYRLIRNMVLGLPLGDTEAGYKFFRRDKIMPVLEACQNPGWFWDTEIIVRAGFNGLKIQQLPCLFIRHPTKISTVRVLPDTLHYLIKLIRFRKIIDNIKKTRAMPPGGSQ